MSFCCRGTHYIPTLLETQGNIGKNSLEHPSLVLQKDSPLPLVTDHPQVLLSKVSFHFGPKLANRARLHEMV
jgi:hypothetical protein